MPPVRSAHTPALHSVPRSHGRGVAKIYDDFCLSVPRLQINMVRVYSLKIGKMFRQTRTQNFCVSKFCHPATAGAWNEVERGGVRGRTGAKPPPKTNT